MRHCAPLPLGRRIELDSAWRAFLVRRGGPAIRPNTESSSGRLRRIPSRRKDLAPSFRRRCAALQVDLGPPACMMASLMMGIDPEPHTSRQVSWGRIRRSWVVASAFWLLVQTAAIFRSTFPRVVTQSWRGAPLDSVRGPLVKQVEHADKRTEGHANSQPGPKNDASCPSPYLPQLTT